MIRRDLRNTLGTAAKAAKLPGVLGAEGTKRG